MIEGLNQLVLLHVSNSLLGKWLRSIMLKQYFAASKGGGGGLSASLRYIALVDIFWCYIPALSHAYGLAWGLMKLECISRMADSIF